MIKKIIYSYFEKLVAETVDYEARIKELSDKFEAADKGQKTYYKLYVKESDAVGKLESRIEELESNRSSR